MIIDWFIISFASNPGEGLIFESFDLVPQTSVILKLMKKKININNVIVCKIVLQFDLNIDFSELEECNRQYAALIWMKHVCIIIVLCDVFEDTKRKSRSTRPSLGPASIAPTSFKLR